MPDPAGSAPTPDSRPGIPCDPDPADVRPGEGPTTGGHDVYVRIVDRAVHRIHDFPDGVTGDYAADGTLIGMLVPGATAVTIDGVVAVPAGTGGAPEPECVVDPCDQPQVYDGVCERHYAEYHSEVPPAAGVGGAATPAGPEEATRRSQHAWWAESARLNVENEAMRAVVVAARALLVQGSGPKWLALRTAVDALDGQEAHRA